MYFIFSNQIELHKKLEAVTLNLWRNLNSSKLLHGFIDSLLSLNLLLGVLLVIYKFDESL